jgi:uncharacterized phiE125 gp8 family phage protein
LIIEVDMRRVNKLKTAAATTGISLAEAKAHMNIDSSFTADDTLIEAYIDIASDYVENYMVRKLINQTWLLFLEQWPSGDYIELSFGTSTSVTSVKYTDSDGDQSTFSTDNYTVDTDSVPARIVLNNDASWPTASLSNSNPIEIEYVTGYGAASTDITDVMITHALKMMVAHYYENREPLYISTNSNTVTPLEKTVDSLLYPYRIWRWIL